MRTVMREALFFSVTAMEPPSARCPLLCNEGGMNGCHDNPGKTYKQDGQSGAMTICIEGQMPASTLSLETTLACSGARTCLFLPQNCHS